MCRQGSRRQSLISSRRKASSLALNWLQHLRRIFSGCVYCTLRLHQAPGNVYSLRVNHHQFCLDMFGHVWTTLGRFLKGVLILVRDFYRMHARCLDCPFLIFGWDDRHIILEDACRLAQWLHNSEAERLVLQHILWVWLFLITRSMHGLDFMARRTYWLGSFLWPEVLAAKGLIRTVGGCSLFHNRFFSRAGVFLRNARHQMWWLSTPVEIPSGHVGFQCFWSWQDESMSPC